MTHKICSYCHTNFDRASLGTIHVGLTDRAKKYLDKDFVEEFQKEMVKSYQACHDKFHTWCLSTFSKHVKKCPECESVLSFEVSQTAEKIASFAPLFVSLIGGALKDNNEEDAKEFVSLIKNVEKLKTEVLRMMCSNKKKPDLKAPQFLLNHGEFSEASKEAVLFQVTVYGAHAYMPLFEDINRATNPLFRFASLACGEPIAVN